MLKTFFRLLKSRKPHKGITLHASSEISAVFVITKEQLLYNSESHYLLNIVRYLTPFGTSPYGRGFARIANRRQKVQLFLRFAITSEYTYPPDFCYSERMIFS